MASMQDTEMHYAFMVTYNSEVRSDKRAIRFFRIYYNTILSIIYYTIINLYNACAFLMFYMCMLEYICTYINNSENFM